VATLVLLRHGESVWNKENLFTGWIDVDLSSEGEKQARAAGQLMREHRLVPDIVHTSVQKRAIRTANLALEEMDLQWLPVRRTWRLNERHYGDLQGRDKSEIRERYGEEQFMLWRRSYDVPPPPLPEGDERSALHDPRYRDLPPDLVPATECLKDVVARMLPWWYDGIVPDLRRGRTVLVSAHGNSLRALVKHLEAMSDADVVELNIPTGQPYVYDLDGDLAARSARYLDEAAALAAAEAVRRQGR